jgi:histidyl-tRNA synthetase
LGLRFDLTVPLVRYYCGNENSLPKPMKSIQIGSVFRAESPQKGRFRQFTQCDIDIIGVKSEIAEMELISATCAALLALGFNGFTILINDRRFLSGLAEFCGFTGERTSSVFIALDKLEKIGLENVRNELLSACQDNPDAVMKFTGIFEKYLDKQKQGKLELDDMKALFPDLFEADYMKPLQNVIEAVQAVSEGRYSIRFDPTLVRGMGYYTGQIFEIKNPGYSGSIAGGGRYDKMVGKFSGRDVPACGFSIGFERAIDILTEKGFQPPFAQQKIALIIDPDRDKGTDVLNAARILRGDDSVVSILPRKKEMKKQLDALKEMGYTKYCAFRGDVNNLELKILE